MPGATQPPETVTQADLVEALNNLANRVPLSVELWTLKEIASYLKKKVTVCRDRVVYQPGFPAAIRIPSGKGRAHPLWKAAEVIAWTEGYKEK